MRISPSAANENHKVILTSGNEKNARWGARTFPSDCGTVTVQVDNGMQYHVQIVPCEVITSLLAGCDGGSKCPSAAFRDVDRSAESWYHEAVDWAVAKKVTNGVSENSFAPDASCTRAQIVTFLWRDLERTSDPLAAAMAAVEENNGKPVCGQSDWAVFDAFRNAAVSATALPAAYYEYYATVENKAKQTEGKMDAKYATDNARYVLTVTALGYDATDVAGYDLTAPLQGLDYVRKQGVNGVIYTLLALDSANYESYLRADLLEIILDEQLADGGYNYGFGDTADPDLTAMAIQAIAPYYGDPAVKAALDRAIACLSALQSENGGFPNM